jgi:hypothetical protein
VKTREIERAKKNIAKQKREARGGGQACPGRGRVIDVSHTRLYAIEVTFAQLEKPLKERGVGLGQGNTYARQGLGEDQGIQIADCRSGGGEESRG